MKKLVLLLAAAFAARAEEAPVQATPAMAELPGVGRAVSAPGSLPPVSAPLFHIGGQTELQPLFMVSIGDPFWRTVAGGIRAEHHFDERWSVAGHLAGGLSLLSAPIEVCSDLSCSSPEADRLRSTPGKLQLLVGAQVGWAPVYGKLSLLGEKTLHFDAYVSAGPELVRELIAPDAASAVSGRWAPGGRVSLGERLFVTDRMTLRVAASELVYVGRVRGRGEAERKLSLEAGLTWFFGGR